MQRRAAARANRLARKQQEGLRRHAAKVQADADILMMAHSLQMCASAPSPPATAPLAPGRTRRLSFSSSPPEVREYVAPPCAPQARLRELPTYTCNVSAAYGCHRPLHMSNAATPAAAAALIASAQEAHRRMIKHRKPGAMKRRRPLRWDVVRVRPPSPVAEHLHRRPVPLVRAPAHVVPPSGGAAA